MDTKDYDNKKLAAMSPEEFRRLVRCGEWTMATDGLVDKETTPCWGYVQADLAIIPKDFAFEFFLFCQRNPLPCPVIDVTEPGDPHPKLAAPEADLRTDLPKYRVYKDGQLIDEPTDVVKYWQNDLVGFVIGSCVSFDWALLSANVRYRTTGVYTTNIQCVPAGRFHGPMVVTSRILNCSYDAVRAIQISSRHLAVHGPPVHIGDPAFIGIKDFYQPDVVSLSEPIPPQEPGEVVMHWGCGITPQTVALESKIPFMITHYPGYMFIIDKLAEEVTVL